MEKEIKKGEIIIYKGERGPEIEVRLEQENIWLSLNQIGFLFDTDKSGISRHISNIFKDKELNRKSTVAKIATVQTEGGRKTKRLIEYYDLDIILSVGYRVNSKRATQFRIWATKKLKSYLLQGYVVNEKRLLQTENKFKELQNTVDFLIQKSKHKLLVGQEQEILSLLADYSKTLSLLEKYDKDKVTLSNKGKSDFVLSYGLARNVINEIKNELVMKKEASEFFGVEPEGRLEGILGNICQTFDGKELYSSIEEKAASILYFIIKDHPFIDGNKRIGSFMFIYFLDKNKYLYKENGERKINDNALTALSLLIAVSDSKEKDKLVKIVTNFLSN